MNEQIDASGGADAARHTVPAKKTPWQKCFIKLGLRQSALARELNCTRSHIARSLQDKRGLISGNMQEKMIAVGHRIGRPLEPSDLLPDL